MTIETAARPGTARSPIAEYLEGRCSRGHHAGSDSGEVASYIPELARVDPDLFGICIATVDGAVYEAGDSRVPFTIQSMSKPLTYGLALELAGEEAVRRRVGVEPSGDPFNEISLRAATGTPVNPMINAGAIACAGIVGESAPDPLGRLLDTYSAYAGRALAVDETVYRSESATGHRNRAIAHLLRGHGVHGRRRPGARPLLSAAVLRRGRLPRPRPRRRYARERRRQPADGGTRSRPGDRPQRVERDDDLRHVRRSRRVARLGRDPGQERRIGGRARRPARAARRRGLLTAARRAGKQRCAASPSRRDLAGS